jgi:RimJ/RimL family protein N-acetyltransferase
VAFTDPAEPVPTELRTDEFVLRPIRAGDAEADYAAIMETRHELRLWEQSSWPEDDFTVEANRADLVGLESRHAEHRAFTYTVRDAGDTECLGCAYVFPTSAAFLTKAAVTALGRVGWTEVDAVVYFWVRASRTESGLDGRLLAELRAWFADEWMLPRTVFVTNERYRHQMELIERTDLNLMFQLREPDKPGGYLVYG